MQSENQKKSEEKAKMKEEAPTKKLPPKISGGAGGGTPVKNSNSSYTRGPTSDEILSTLLRINNFDSISSIKDESLDIDLSACVTISADTSGMMNGNSLSSNDFWRVLDESAQNPGQLDITTSSDDGAGSGNNTASLIDISNGITTEGTMANVGNLEEHTLPLIVKQENLSSFSGTFLRPDPPAMSVSPLKKITKSLPAEQADKLRKPKTKSNTTVVVADQRPVERKKPKTTIALLVKQEPPEQLLANDDHNQTNKFNDNNSPNNLPSISHHSFNIFMTPVENNNSTTGAQQNFCTSQEIPANSYSTIADDETVCSTTHERNLPPVTQPDEQVAPPPEPIFKCEDCNGLVLHGLQEFAIHESASHKILYKCNECPKDFENEAGLKKHMKTHRSVESRKDAWKKCPDCGKCLKLGSMWMHRKIHSDNKKYGCDICGQKFVQKINLTHHSRMHTSEKPYECPECQKRFQERSHLQRHQKYHAQTRSYRCEKCGKMYKTERCLKVHNLVHLEQRPFACNVCDKSFISNSKLKQHSNIHTGERPFKCNYCPRDFTNFPNWLKHTRRRHKVDHKTGEHLENIPSYCSKKSAKSTAAKAEKLQPAAVPNPSVSEPTSLANDKPKEETVAKPQPKRKKKINTPLEPQPVVSSDPTLQTDMQSTSVVSTALVTKATKVKRERKQPTPKQVQKPPTPPAIKKELIDSTEHPTRQDTTTTIEETKATTSTNFRDLHCLSITSAEELIMEQALEMEECGLYDAPRSSVGLDTDNAVSAESAAALHFQIKNEFIDIKEEFISLSEANNRVLCSSLESSPYSSPASIEFPASNSVVVTTSAAAATPTTASDQCISSASYYMPSFRLNSGPVATNMNSPITNTSTVTTATNGISGTLLQSIQQLPTHQQQEQQRQQIPSTQALINHLYVPITMSMPLLMQPQQCTTHQVLPSVDTLLFTHANSKFFHGKTAAQATAHHNL